MSRQRKRRLLRKKEAWSQDKLKPLLEGRPLFFSVDSNSWAYPFKGDKPTLSIIPFSFLLQHIEASVDDRYLLVALEGQGCWRVPFVYPVSPTDLHKSGLDYLRCVSLAEALNKLLKA